ncbi:transcriptional regulator, TrmB (plasmid) [Halobacterium sp. DL1]|nr:transcriptional regulator, TrmB [Halobacterium sp. DL1]
MKYTDFELTTMTPDHDHIRPDGGIDTLDPPPIDVLNEETLEPETLAENAPRLETVVELLNRPALARVYVYVCYWGPVAPPEVMDTLDLSKSTTYEYVDRLVDLGLVDRDDSTRPQQLTAEPIIIVEQYAPIVITPTVLHALALQEVDEDVEYFVDRYGLGKLIAALRGAGLHFAGKTTQRMVASDIDVRETEAMMIIYALKPALAVGREHDPFFEYLFPDVHTEMDLPDLDDIADAPAQSSDPDR